MKSFLLEEDRSVLPLDDFDRQSGGYRCTAHNGGQQLLEGSGGDRSLKHVIVALGVAVSVAT